MRYKNISNKKLHGSELNPAFPTACYDDACISPGCSRSTGLLSLCVTFRSLCMESYVVTPVNSNPLQKRSLIAPCCFFSPPLYSNICGCALAVRSCRDLLRWVWYVTATASPIAYSSVHAPGHAWVRLPLTACQRDLIKIYEKFAYLQRKLDVLVRNGRN